METNDIIIRKGSPTDMEPLIELLRDLFSIEQDFVFDEAKQRRGLELMMDEISRERCLLVAEHEGRVVGMCSAQTLISTAEGGLVALIEDMVVRHDWRGKGIGRRLLASIEEWAKNKGASRMQLLADINNRPALRFYKINNWFTTQLICLRRRESV